ncbi:hypothetical protein F4780DRAFT_169184 [Xylariomycetidae sp. FL0641]|nr:hypothetical protein F4780DRAFT_169184 [Xylariomycetidae sp. FL0641]
MESSQLSGTSSRPCKPTTSRFDDDSQPSLSQDVFLPPLEDTQESELIEVDEDFFDGQSGDLPTTNNPATTNDPPKPNLVSRPEGIESLSDLKIDFQYPKAPAPRRMFKSSTGPHPHTGLPPRSAPYQPPNGPHPNAELHTRRGPYDPPIPNTFKQTESTQGRLPGREEGPLHEESWVQPPSSSDQTMQAGSSDPDEERRREHGEEVIVSHHESVYRPPQVNEEKPEQVVSRGTPPEKPRVGKQESINHPVVCEARSAAKAGRPLPYRAAHNELPKSLEDIRKRALAQTSSPRRASPNKVSATHDPGVAIDLSPSRNAQNPHDQYRVSRNSQKAKHRATHQSPGDLAFDEGRGQATAKTSTHKHHSPRDHDPVASHQIRPVARPLSRNSTVSNMAKHRAPRRSRPERLSPNFEHEGLESRKDIARAMNKYYAYEERLAKHWTKKFRDFQDQVEDQLAAKDALVQQHVADIASRDEIIAEWKAKVQETQTLHQEQASEHEMSRSRIKKLEEKIRTLRGRLNQATEEQQKIYAACSKKCQKVTSELELKEKEHKMAVEHALQTSESAQAKIKKSVAEVTVASRTETERLNKIVEVQKAQLEERGKEAKREREAAEYLQTQLDESQKMNSESLKLLATQNTDLLQRAEQQQSKTDSMQICIGNQDQKTRGSTICHYGPRVLNGNFEGYTEGHRCNRRGSN